MSSEDNKTELPLSVGYLALSQRYAGLFESAERNYRRAIAIAKPGHEGLAPSNLDALISELEYWKGTSGRMTPRMNG